MINYRYFDRVFPRSCSEAFPADRACAIEIYSPTPVFSIFVAVVFVSFCFLFIFLGV
jgi:hypothetical protein